jgi:hypothetical protein
MEGIYRSWLENGQQMQEGNYVHGKKEGVYRKWHPNGQLHSELNYVHDKIDGIHREWFENGQLCSELNYKDGREVEMESSNDETTYNEQQSNWTENDKKSFKADCKRGLEDSNSALTQTQRIKYCDCMMDKIETNYPNKYSQQNMEVMKRLAKSCLLGL